MRLCYWRVHIGPLPLQAGNALSGQIEGEDSGLSRKRSDVGDEELSEQSAHQRHAC
jgi:hypothetical protein